MCAGLFKLNQFQVSQRSVRLGIAYVFDRCIVLALRTNRTPHCVVSAPKGRRETQPDASIRSCYPISMPFLQFWDRLDTTTYDYYDFTCACHGRSIQEWWERRVQHPKSR